MAQPGFNPLAPRHTEAMSLQETLLHCWLARLPAERVPLSDLAGYLGWWRRTVVPFLEASSDEFERSVAELLAREGFLSTLERVKAKTGIVGDASWDDGNEPHLVVEIDAGRVRDEIEVLERHGFDVLVSMVEYAPHPSVLDSKLHVHHLPVDDLTPPRRDQAEAFAEVLERVYAQDQRMVVHCMAGIGRTTTIIVAGHLLLGERLSDLTAQVEVRNPDYRRAGTQWSFLEDLADDLGRR